MNHFSLIVGLYRLLASLSKQNTKLNKENEIQNLTNIFTQSGAINFNCLSFNLNTNERTLIEIASVENEAEEKRVEMKMDNDKNKTDEETKTFYSEQWIF